MKKQIDELVLVSCVGLKKSPGTNCQRVLCQRLV